MLGLGAGITKSKVKRNTYAVFDGTDDFITVPDNNALSFSPDPGFGLSMWLNLNSGNHGILVKNQEYILHVRSDGDITFICVDDSNDKKNRLIANDSFVFNQWVHLIVEFSDAYTPGGSATKPRIFQNNSSPSQASTLDAEFSEMENTTNDLIIGKTNLSVGGDTTTGALTFLNGAMTNLHIYTGILTDAERSNVYNAGKDGNFSNIVDNTIVASYLLTSDLNDSSGNGHNGSSGSGQSPIFTTV